MKHKYKEKCDVCGKWSQYYTITDNGTPTGFLICDECRGNADQMKLEV